MNITTEGFSPGSKKVLSPDAPLPMQMMAAKGVIPGASPAEIVSVIAVLSESSSSEVKKTALEAFGRLPAPLLNGALQSELQRPVLALLTDKHGTDRGILPKLLAQRWMDEDLLCFLSSRADEAAGEIIGTNEALLLRFPGAIEKLYLNRKVRMSTADRLIDLAVRNGLELGFAAFKAAAEAIQDQLIPEASEEPNYQDELFKEIEREAAEIELPELEGLVEVDDDGNEKLADKMIPLFVKIQNASISEKIRMATVGDASARMLLVRDSNRLVSEAAVRSPRMTENEGAQIAAMRSVSEDVLRIVASSRDLVRSYQVKLNLVMNPRTPLTFSSRLLPHLRANDLKLISRSKNVPGAVSKAAKLAISRRQ